MRQRIYHACQDAGDVYCPCDLGLAGMCLACPVQNGQNDCADCAWSGCCVLLQAEHHAQPKAAPRSEAIVQLLREKNFGSSAFALTVKAPRHLLDSLRSPGSFVMLRPLDRPTHYYLPLTVAGINTEESSLTFFIQEVGIKSRAVRHASKLVMRAPYRNGLVGISQLQRRSGGKILLVAKGIAQGVALRVTECLLSAGHQLDVSLGPGEIGSILVVKQLLSLGANVIEMPKTSDRNRQQIATLLKENSYTALISAGSNQQHQGLADLLPDHSPSTAFIFTNNAIMSCAEGICGSCEHAASSGTFRACKASDWSLPPQGGYTHENV